MEGLHKEEESMFIEYTELLASMYLTEKMLEFEAVEISNLKRFVEHNICFAFAKDSRIAS